MVGEGVNGVSTIQSFGFIKHPPNSSPLILFPHHLQRPEFGPMDSEKKQGTEAIGDSATLKRPIPTRPWSRPDFEATLI